MKGYTRFTLFVHLSIHPSCRPSVHPSVCDYLECPDDDSHCFQHYVAGSMQDCSISSALAMESYTKPLIWCMVNLCQDIGCDWISTFPLLLHGRPCDLCIFGLHKVNVWVSVFKCGMLRALWGQVLPNHNIYIYFVIFIFLPCFLVIMVFIHGQHPDSNLKCFYSISMILCMIYVYHTGGCILKIWAFNYIMISNAEAIHQLSWSIIKALTRNLNQSRLIVSKIISQCIFCGNDLDRSH